MRTIAGEGVTLEPQLASHAAELYAVISDPTLYEFIDNKEPASEAALRERLARLESGKSPDGTEHWLNWVIRNAAGEVVGYVQATVTPIMPPRSPTSLAAPTGARATPARPVPR